MFERRRRRSLGICTTSWALCGAVLALRCAVIAAPAAAGEVPAPSAQEAPAVAEPSPPLDGSASAARAGLRIYVDPVTGELTSHPAPGQAERLSAALLEQAMEQESRRVPGDLVPFFLSQGGTGVFLDGRFRSATVVRVRPDGSLSFACTGGEAVDGLLHLHETTIPAVPAPAMR